MTSTESPPPGGSRGGDPRTSVPSGMAGFVGVISDIDGVVLVFPSTIDEQSREFVRAAAACGFSLHNH
ncbi:MAG TPA: hypothetical protein VME46_24040 [Acidimicrobiales bacterium]|nr:hypothetical protein [Acidimicrobiales bacterium]